MVLKDAARLNGSIGIRSHLVDDVSTESVVEKLIGRENYWSWSFEMKLLLMREGTWKAAVDVTSTDTVNEDVSLCALATIGLHVDKRNYSHIRKCKTAKEAWDKLNVVFGDSGFSNEVFC